jgi:glycosyltransferase involved in cell wall biosynthesis
MTVAYLVSRFPHVSETFIVREVAGVAAEGVDVELRSLYPPVDPTVHPEAEPWVAGLRRPSPLEGVAALGWWAVRRPLRLASSLAAVTAGYGRRPALCARALATAALGAAHAREIASEGRVAHVHAHYATYPALAAWLVRRLAGVPYSFTAHAHDLYVDQSMLARKVRDAAFVVTISDFNRRFLEPYGGGAEVVHCGVDPERAPFAPRAPAADGPVRALCVASLQEYKGHAVLLDALARPGLERVEVDLVGGGALRDALEARARTLGIAERVRFHGSLPAPRVAELLAAADLFVLPSVVAADGQMEGIPVALMEALAHGVPVVTTRLSGIPELVRDGETGLLAEPGDPGSLAEALAAVLADPEAAQVRAQAGRRLVEEEFDLRASARRMAELLSRR